MAINAIDSAYIVVMIYLCGMAGMAVWGFLQKKKMAKSESQDISDMEAHFLAGRNFGPVVGFLNMAATFISGYVVVGVPTVAQDYGFVALAFLPLCSCAGYCGTPMWHRLRRLGANRKYMSPNDFCSDRYHSKYLRSLTSLLGCMHMLFVMCLEWWALGRIVDDFTQGAVNGKVVVWCLGFFVFFCEVMGGMSSVAMTDAIQCAILLASFWIMPMLCDYEFGGFDDIADVGCQNEKLTFTKWPSLPPAYGTTKQENWTTAFSEKYPEITADGLYNVTYTGCWMYTKPWLSLYPPRYFAHLMFTIAVAFLPFGVSPFAAHRTMVAKSDRALQQGLTPLHLFPLMFFVPVILLGLTRTAIFPAVAGGAYPHGPEAFTTMVTYWLEAGGFKSFVGILVVASCVCSFMSTADSICLATSSILTMDFWVNGWCKGNASQESTLLCSKTTSLLIIIAGCAIALYADVGMLDLLDISFMFLNTMAPIYWGMWWSVHSISLSVGCTFGTIMGIAVKVHQMEGAADKQGYCDSTCDPIYCGWYFGSWFYGAIVAHGTMLVVEFGMRYFAPELLEDYDPEKAVSWRKNDIMDPETMMYYGDKNLTIKVITEDVFRKGKPNGVREWYDTWFGKISQVLGYAPIWAFPWWGDHENSCNSFGPAEEIVGGWPKWAQTVIILQVLSTLNLSFCTWVLWYTPPEMDIGALDDLGQESGPAKWAQETGVSSLGMNAQIRKFSQELLKGKESFKVKDSIPNSAVDALRAKAKANAVVPQSTLLGGTGDDLGEMVT